MLNQFSFSKLIVGNCLKYKKLLHSSFFCVVNCQRNMNMKLCIKDHHNQQANVEFENYDGTKKAAARKF